MWLRIQCDAPTSTDFMIERIGARYDLCNIFDLLRYLFPTPPVTVRWRRRMLAFGSGDPTRAICFSLIAQAFQGVRYPILPDVTKIKACNGSRQVRAEIKHIRHHSLFVPRDFDLSPCFEIVNPSIAGEFDHRRLNWASLPEGAGHGRGKEKGNRTGDSKPAEIPEATCDPVFRKGGGEDLLADIDGGRRDQ